MKRKQKPSPRFVRNQTKLANALKVTRMTISRWRRIPGSPTCTANGRYDVESWRKWVQSEGRKHPVGNEAEIGQLKAKNIRLHSERLEYDIAQLKRDHVALVDVRKWGQELSEAVTTTVRTIHTCAPSVVMLSVPDAEIQLRELEDEIFTKLHEIKDKEA